MSMSSSSSPLWTIPIKLLTNLSRWRHTVLRAWGACYGPLCLRKQLGYFLLHSKFCLQGSVQCQGTEVDSALESVDWGKNSILTKAGRQHLMSEWKTKLIRIGREGLWSAVCKLRTREAGGVVQSEWSPGILGSCGVLWVPGHIQRPKNQGLMV